MEDLGVEGGDIEMYIKEIGLECVVGVILLRIRHKGRALVDKTTNLRAPINSGEFLDSSRSCY